MDIAFIRLNLTHIFEITKKMKLYTWLWRYTYLLLLISMLWHRQAIFKSKGDRLCSSAECTYSTIVKFKTSYTYNIYTWSLSIYMYLHKYIHTNTHTYMFVAKFDALAQASDIRIEKKQVVFLCWIHDYTKSPADWMPADKPTELSRIKQKLELDSPSLWSASIQPTRPNCQLVSAPGSGDRHVYCC